MLRSCSITGFWDCEYLYPTESKFAQIWRFVRHTTNLLLIQVGEREGREHVFYKDEQVEGSFYSRLRLHQRCDLPVLGLGQSPIPYFHLHLPYSRSSSGSSNGEGKTAAVARGAGATTWSFLLLGKTLLPFLCWWHACQEPRKPLIFTGKELGGPPEWTSGVPLRQHLGLVLCSPTHSYTTGLHYGSNMLQPGYYQVHPFHLVPFICFKTGNALVRLLKLIGDQSFTGSGRTGRSGFTGAFLVLECITVGRWVMYVIAVMKTYPDCVNCCWYD